MKSFKEFLEQTNLKPNELKVGDKVKNCNKDCEHYGSTGIVTKIIKLIDGDHIAGNEIEYECDCDGTTWKKGEKLKKTEIQLEKPDHRE